MPAWAVHILERVAGEALIGRQRGTVHLKELEEGELGRGNSQCKASRLERPKHQVGSWSPEGHGPLEPLEGSGVDPGLGRIPLAALKGKEGKAEAGKAEAGLEALAVIQA